MLFFLQCYDAPRHLHSFPTRRSSDLAARGLTSASLLAAPDTLEARTFRTRSAARCRRAASTDRKSTRLNSSHMSISYAVFCLKKKIITYAMSLLDFSITWHLCSYSDL